MNMMMVSDENIRELMDLIAEEERFRDEFAREVERLELEIRDKSRLFEQAARRLEEANATIERLQREVNDAIVRDNLL